MAIVAITLEYGKQQTVDLGLPLEITCRVLTESLAQAFHLESDVGETLVLVDKSSAANRVLAANATLGDLEILHGTKLALVSQKNIEARPVPQGRAYLVINGREVSIKGAYLSIGRRDPKRGYFPDVDLSDLDVSKICSRKHAAIEFNEKGYVIKDLGSSNGTWINGHRIPPENAQPIINGDEIVFGKNGVKMVFKRGDQGGEITEVSI